MDNNEAVGESGGGILGAPGTSTTIVDSEIDHNLAGTGGGPSAGGNGGGVAVLGATLLIQGSNIHDNKALIVSEIGGDGAGVYAQPLGGQIRP